MYVYSYVNINPIVAQSYSRGNDFKKVTYSTFGCLYTYFHFSDWMHFQIKVLKDFSLFTRIYKIILSYLPHLPPPPQILSLYLLLYTKSYSYNCRNYPTNPPTPQDNDLSKLFNHKLSDDNLTKKYLSGQMIFKVDFF